MKKFNFYMESGYTVEFEFEADSLEEAEAKAEEWALGSQRDVLSGDLWLDFAEGFHRVEEVEDE